MITGVANVLEAYFEGLYHADSKRLAAVFHPDARYVNTVNSDYMNYSIPEYFSIINRRTSPAETKDKYENRIVSIELGSVNMAFAKVSVDMMGRNYLDYLTLIFDDSGWRIISKVFFYTAILQES